MHELSILRNVFDIVEDALGKDPKQIKSISMTIGEFSGVIADNLKFAFDIAREGTIFEEAELKIKMVPFNARCKKCGREFTFDEFIMLCPECNSSDLDIISGKELFVESVEVID